MQTLEVLIEENAFGDVRQVEVVADAQVSTLVAELVRELDLPQMDPYGNRLVYMLRYAPEGPILPDDRTLIASGIKPGTRLAIHSYVLNGSVATLMNLSQVRAASSFHAAETFADADSFPILEKDTTGRFPAVKKPRRWTRRGFLMLGGAVVGAGSVGLGYAMYHKLTHGNFSMTEHNKPVHTKSFVPGAAKVQLSFTGHKQPVRSVSWSPDGTRLASGADDARLLLWDTNGVVHMQAQQSGAVRAVAWSPDGQRIAFGAANQVTFLGSLTGATLARSTHHTAAITSLAWSPHYPAQVVSGALDKQAIVWNASTYMSQTIFTRHTTPVESVSWAADGQTIGSCSHGGAVRAWNASSGAEVHSFFLDAQLPMRALAFAPSGGKLAVGGDDGIVRLWNGLMCQKSAQGKFGVQCQDVPLRLHVHTKPVRALAWSPDGRFLATGGDDGIVAIWYPASSQTPLLTIRHVAPVLALAWSPGGRQVATASGNTVMIWGLQ